MVLAILLQRRSAGIGSGVGGTDSGAYTATGGIDRLLVRSTIVLALVFFGSALGMLFV